MPTVKKTFEPGECEECGAKIRRYRTVHRFCSTKCRNKFHVKERNAKLIQLSNLQQTKGTEE